MTVERDARPDGLGRRLERFRAATRALERSGRPDGAEAGRTLDAASLADRLAAATGGEVVRGDGGLVVRVEPPSRPLPVDRERLAGLPGQPPAPVPLVCLDTETTGLATAAGTVAFLIGLGWWERDRFRQVQLLLPDHGEERALLAALGAAIPAGAWLVTYNGRGFDWPLLEVRYRMACRPPPAHAGHLDLLPLVRRLFRHRLEDARLRTVEEGLLGIERHGDVEGWEIPRRYLGFLRGGPVEPLVDVVRHNDQDVRSLARLLALLDHAYGDPEVRRDAPGGDLAGLARAFAREHRLDAALECYDVALVASERAAPAASVAPPPVARPAAALPPPAEPWWSPRVAADFGGRPVSRPTDLTAVNRAAFAMPWTSERIAVERAHLLRRLGRWDAAAEAWAELVRSGGRVSIVAAVELAKLHEHRRRDVAAALGVVTDGLRAAERRRRLGRPEPRLEADLLRRGVRLRRRLSGRPSEAVRALPHDPHLGHLRRDERPSETLASAPQEDRGPVRHAVEAVVLHRQ